MTVVLFSVRLYNLFIFDANKDEFLFLSKIFEAKAHTLSSIWQTFHVHLLAWLDVIGTNELDEIVLARCVMWILSIATATMLYRIYRHFMSSSAAFFCVFAYAAFSYVIQHGASFRADPIAAFLLVGTGLALMHHGLVSSLLAGLGAALATLITIKSVFYWPALGALLLLRFYTIREDNSSYPAWRDAATTAGAAVVVGFLLLWYHASTLGQAPPGGGPGLILEDAFSKTLWETTLFPHLGYAVYALKENLVFFTTFLVGLRVSIFAVIRTQGKQRAQWLATLALATPMLSLLVYRNVFPYFYVFLLPFPAILCGVAVDNLTAREPRKTVHTVLAIFTIGIVIQASGAIAHNAGRTQTTQRETLQAVHTAFPEAVPYIDCCSMMSTYPHVGFFMSTWGFEKYKSRDAPVMREHLKQRQPVFVLANHPALDLRMPSTNRKLSLLSEDVKTLRNNYVHYWGPLYVAGKQLDVKNGHSAPFRIVISGRYTLESARSAHIDGQLLTRGDAIELSQGRHTVTTDAPGETALLRWSDVSSLPKTTPPDRPVFSGFRVF